MRILIQTFLRKSNMHFAAHPFQIQMFITNGCILIKHLIEFTQFE